MEDNPSQLQQPFTRDVRRSLVASLLQNAVRAQRECWEFSHLLQQFLGTDIDNLQERIDQLVDASNREELFPQYVQDILNEAEHV